MSNTLTNSTDPPTKPPLWQRVLARYRQRPLLYGFGTVLLLTVLMVWLSSLSSTGGPESRGSFTEKSRRDSHIQFVVDSLGQLDEYDAWRYTEMLRDNLNQWIGQLELSGVWPVDPFVPNRIPPPLQQAWGFDTAKRQRLTFTLEDARWIQGAMWMRDISRGVRRRLAAAKGGGVVDRLSLAQGLLDWTIRNIALQEGDAPVPALAWESVLWGRGRANSRPWVFMELCRQQGLESALLAYRDPEKPGTDKAPNYRPWILAVMIPEGKQSKLYLFDHTLGLPIPGPGGKGVATLKQAVQQPEVLRQLDVGVRKYLVESAHLKNGLMASVFPSPFLLSRRMQLLESELQGQNRVSLTAYFSDVAGRFDKALWEAAGADKTKKTETPEKTVGTEKTDKTEKTVGTEKTDKTEKTVGTEKTEKAEKTVGTQIWVWPGFCLEQFRRQQERQAERGLLDPRLFPFGVSGFEQKGEKNKELMREHLKSFQELAQAQGQLPQELQEGAMLATVQRRQSEEPVPGFLWKGRMLQFKGIYGDIRQDAAEGAALKRGAPNVYQSGRISELELEQIQRDLEADLKKVQAAEQEAISQGAPAPIVYGMQRKAFELQREIAGFPDFRIQRQFVRILATYWLGIVAYERGDYDEAVRYFSQVRDSELAILEETAKMVREQIAKRVKDPKQRAEGMFDFWAKALAAGVHYNLARSLEASGQLAKAIALYEEDNSPDSRHGSLLRARRLRQELQAKEKAAAK